LISRTKIQIWMTFNRCVCREIPKLLHVTLCIWLVVLFFWCYQCVSCLVLWGAVGVPMLLIDNILLLGVSVKQGHLLAALWKHAHRLARVEADDVCALDVMCPAVSWRLS
jgi:hypothetical protein